MTNCKNCGAPLPANGKCEYCGSFYPEHQHIMETKVSYSDDIVLDCTTLDSSHRQYIHGMVPMGTSTLIVDGQEMPVVIETVRTEMEERGTRFEITCVAYL